MTRRGWFFVTYFAVLGVGVSLAVRPVPRLLWNETASVPVGLYRIQPTVPVRVGDIVALRLPEREATLLATRGYLPFGVPLLKPVAALAGQSVCRTGIHITIDGKPVGDAKTVDHRGRKLPLWQGCQRLGPGQVFVMNTAVPTSLDGRYFGVLSMDTVIGRAVPVHVQTGEAEPAPPHFGPLPDLPDPERERPLLGPPMIPVKPGEPPIE
ncbi:S26 family signal peptidase [Acidomonas methanolica]|uniref:Conjugal transfer protein TraF n=1 Tax=Acidomonas methanolica NBRC 104435 TaxID=1231351 RepID=A0A023D9J7_ACIMT|nr:S26 family signal peptidase [Acidomonas methanolica]MBU2655757.1 S26 family signal peptidase [Acidomonas methanolica]TCS19074.1 conjugative transfer signal peptidase TraF [Acidomonas methanolica]GAJ30822.1 conjugal transfer protein TraF [Acidomonas methanolica NBRC 104435]GBQ53039.1 conjugal transfer protein precursor [Acidomonas methanolica]GEL00701.1 peptidase S26 [Acidomonas methanolica NBRC 104435]